MSQKLSSKIALVTGGSSGIGLATSKRLATEGAYVFITGRRQLELDAAAKELGSSVTGIRCDAADLAELEIRVNAISPGVVPTPGYDLLGVSKEEVERFIGVQAANIPLGRVGTPDEIAKAVVFLASDDSSFVNGIELFVDGGGAQI